MLRTESILRKYKKATERRRSWVSWPRMPLRAICSHRFSSFPQVDGDGCKSRPSSVELRQEDRDLNAAHSLACASLLPIQPLVIVFFHGGHTLFLLGLDVLLRLGRLCPERLYLGICLLPDSFES
jgi:hypothetical protein